MTKVARSREDYKIGLVCALMDDLTAIMKSLDEEHDDLPLGGYHPAVYCLGRIGRHNVVIGCMGIPGVASAAELANDMQCTFPSLKFFLAVGTAGGVPSPDVDIRLGDVVVSWPKDGHHNGVVNYRFGALVRGHSHNRPMNRPPEFLLSKMDQLASVIRQGTSEFPQFLSEICDLPRFSRPNTHRDVLFRPESEHIGGAECEGCTTETIQRVDRHSHRPEIFHGAIASADEVMCDGKTRDSISRGLGGVKCFDTEAAGLTTRCRCLVIRGISNYADAHKNKTWQPYAAATAAAYAKALLVSIQPEEMPHQILFL